MNRWKRVVARRQRKAHARYLAERARQQALAAQDAQDEVRKVAFWSQKGQQGMGPGGEAKPTILRRTDETNRLLERMLSAA
jgi:hypothetical protein